MTEFFMLLSGIETWYPLNIPFRIENMRSTLEERTFYSIIPIEEIELPPVSYMMCYQIRGANG